MVNAQLREASHAVESRRRFDTVAVSCVFGDPRDARTWSGAPFRVSEELERCGIAVRGIHPRLSRREKYGLAACYAMRLYGWPRAMEQVLRATDARRLLARRTAEAARVAGVSDVLHMGTLDLSPDASVPGLRHWIYCDQTWHQSLRHRVDAATYTARGARVFEMLERAAFAQAEHVFSFGAATRSDLIAHYGLPAGKVSVAGSGMGLIDPYFGPKSHAEGPLLFVAKHFFVEKGGRLLLDAFRLARRQHPELRLAIVGPEAWRNEVLGDPQVEFHSGLPWADLQQLYRSARLLVQPMLNDPWGQVYLEALVSRTPVIGLKRNGLPEILRDGRYGFLVDRAEPDALAAAIMHAIADSDRLATMGEAGQRHVMANYSWQRVARAIAFA
jgi:glycosyltransferase involved in cell wall biosynthesis